MITHIFKSPLPSFTFTFKDGMTAVFLHGRYLTTDERLASEMRAEIGNESNIGPHKSRHPYIFIDPDEYEIDSEALTPLEKIRLEAKEEARKELLAEQAAERARAMDAIGNVSETSNVGFAKSLSTTNTTGETAMGSTGDMSAAAANAANRTNVTNPPGTVTPAVHTDAAKALATPPANAKLIAPTAESTANSMSARLANLANRNN